MITLARYSEDAKSRAEAVTQKMFSISWDYKRSQKVARRGSAGVRARRRAYIICCLLYVCVSLSLSLSLYIYIYIYVYTCIYIYIYTYIYICIYTCVHVYIYIYI